MEKKIIYVKNLWRKEAHQDKINEVKSLILLFLIDIKYNCLK